MPTDTTIPTKLFVYGIFLGDSMRSAYGMTNPSYDTVYDFVTVGSSIVQAVHIPNEGASTGDSGRFGSRLSLTGVTVDYDPTRWESLDRLEAGYDRIIVTTTHGERVYMYACHSEAFKNHSTYVPWEQRKEVATSER